MVLNIIPKPNNIKINKGNIFFSNYQILIEKRYQNAAILLNEELEHRIKIDANEAPVIIRFIIDKDIDDEGYKLIVDKNGIFIYGQNEKGLYYGTRTLSMLLNLKGKRKERLSCPCLEIDDKPKYGHRSFMLDESRHFFGVDEVKKIISMLSDLKINYFHWHLSDDQGFRINFKTFPKLKEIASKRNKTKIESMDNDSWDNNVYEGCYDYHQIKEIISFAKQRYVEIIPEIDIPGHTSAIVAAYPFLHCSNKQCEVRGDFGVFSDILCLGKQSSYDFIRSLLDELCILFKDSMYIHIGGDEVSHLNHEKCDDCKRMLEKLNLKSFDELQAYFSNMMAKHILDTTNKKVIMWHDGIQDNTDDRIILQYWDYRMDARRIDYINKGRTTIYSPCSQFYFNDPYAELSLYKTYITGIRLDGLDKSAIKNIIGMECCLWTEWVDSNISLEFQIMPRLLAFSETTWTKKTNQNFDELVDKIEHFDAFYSHYNLVRAPKKIYIPKDEEYAKEISRLYRKDKKYIELELANINKEER